MKGRRSGLSQDAPNVVKLFASRDSLARNIVHGDGASQSLFEWGISVRCLWNLSSLIYVYTLTDGICGIEVKESR